jgi:hypothetical protein
VVLKPLQIYITFFIQITSPNTLKIHGFHQAIEEQVLLPNACHQGGEIADFVIIPKSIVVYGTL